MTDTYGATGSAGGDAREKVKVPAILLMVVGGLTVAAALVGLVQSLLGTNEAQMAQVLNDPNVPEGLKSAMGTMNSMGPISSILQLALGVVTFLGGLKMKNLESFGLAMAGSIIAVIPCFGSCCCIGIPIGIWSLIVLNKPEVKAAFR